ncbi:anti-sigma factor RsbA family regulatory protein [Nocardioides guangzhouensis]|uniref:anti-sigma factor RsbA family regulatory protein n=1 Tax=Nocardioides guangzhouensis TaxID=2497878 RepID=UPI0014386992|nr:anti-sigma factor RsbA family regulatory protein [Nocardioides guangzhouensis]
MGDAGTRRTFTHEVVFYDGPDEHARAVLPFIVEGLERDERVVVALLPDATAEVDGALGGDSGVEFLDMAELGANPARIIPAWHSLLHGRGERGIRGVGEPLWQGRRPPEVAEAQLHEALLNVAFDDGPGWRLLCPYDARSLPDDVLAEARRSHPVVYDPDAEPATSPYAGHRHAHRTFAEGLPVPPADAVRIEFEATDLATLRGVVRRVAAAARVGDDAGDDLVLATHELAMNSVQHGGGHGVLLTWQDPDALVVEVRDTGVIDDPLVGRTMPDFGSVSGRGIWMANQLCSLVQVRSGREGTQVRLHSWL